VKSLFIKTDVDEIIARINALTPETQRQWGKMTITQMMAHCTYGIEVAVGDKYASRTLVGKLIGGFFKSMTTNDKSFGHGSPTHPDYIIANPDTFEEEKTKLINVVNKFYDGGKPGVTDKPHAFFGHLTPTEWGSLMYKHTDHHLRQFGA